ncbi:MAG: zinc ABC transporter substrate-binding protein [Clostridia bacterium]|nr:zinc ABC transporter substrate-binding protein [Clostridia bacterium]
MKKPKLKALIALLLALTLCLSLAACGGNEADKNAGADAKNASLSVVCSIFPVYDFVRTVAGDRANVSLLLPPGMDSHEYEPSVGDMVACDKADLFIYTDSEMEIWADNLTGGLSHARVIRCADGIDLEALSEQWEALEHGEEHEEEHGHAHKYDAHIWLDPTLAVIMSQNIEKALSQADPANAEYYKANLDALTAELMLLDSEFAALFARHPDGTLYFGGEFAYSHFIRRYGVNYLSAYDSCGENEEVNLGKLIEMTNRMKAEGAGYVFTDEHSQGLIASQISSETGAEVIVFHTLHSVSRDEMKLSYTDIMRRNYAAVQGALGEVNND